MKRISVEEMKRLQIEILKDVHQFCESNNIRYSLIFGTLLGAIRHKGYIPWDDDIDIAMPRADYERFISLYKSKNGYFYVYDYRKDKDYHHPYAKVADTRTILEENVSMKNIGINIDVFPFDNLFDTEEECNSFIKKLNIYKKFYRIKLVKPGKKNSLAKRILIRLAKIPCSVLSMKAITKREYEIVSTLQNDKAKFVGLAVDPEIGAAFRSVYPSSMFEKFVKVPFDGEEFYAIASYDKWLAKMYGDYMTPPPSGNRTSPHTLSNIYWI